MTPPAPAIAARGLTKRYRGEKVAVDELTFTVLPGQISALLGPNGAGKTSTIRMVLGLSRPDSGHVQILGCPVGLGNEVLHRVGALVDGPGFVPHLSGVANLKLLWRAGGQAWPPPRLDTALDVAGLGYAIDQKVKQYSMGMKQRLMLAQALMGGPDVLVLDEPANGLDPAEVRTLRRTLSQMAEAGTAVLISSHQLAEIQQVATHAVVMSHGRLIAAGPLAELLHRQGDRHHFRVDDPTAAHDVLRAQRGVTAASLDADILTVVAAGVPTRDLTRALVAAGIGVESVEHDDLSLEDAFLTLTTEHEQ